MKRDGFHPKPGPGLVRWLRAIFLTGCVASVCACGSHKESGDGSDLIQRGWDAFQLGDYKLALARFEEAKNAPGADEETRLRATHGLASVWDLRRPVATQDDALADSLYREIIDQAPGHELAAWSSLAIARMTHLVPVGEEPDYEAVREAYQEVIDQYPDHLAGHEALIYQQSTLIQSLDPEATRRAVERLTAWLDAHPESAFQSAAWSLLAQAHETLGDPDRQLDALLKELETSEVDPLNPSSADQSWRYWQIATTAEFLAGRFDIARTYYRRLMEEYPLDFRKFAARQALKRMDEVEARLREEEAGG